jgi:hypothetical protein
MRRRRSRTKFALAQEDRPHTSANTGAGTRSNAPRSRATWAIARARTVSEPRVPGFARALSASESRISASAKLARFSSALRDFPKTSSSCSKNCPRASRSSSRATARMNEDRPPQSSQNQFSQRRAGMRPKCLTLFVTRMTFCATAWAAIMASKLAIGVPRRARSAAMRPK